MFEVFTTIIYVLILNCTVTALLAHNLSTVGFLFQGFYYSFLVKKQVIEML